MNSPLDFYTQQVEDLRSAANQALARYRLVWTKLIVLGLVAVAVFYVSLSAKTLPLWTPVLLIPIGAAFGKESKRALDERWRCSRLRDYYETGIAHCPRCTGIGCETYTRAAHGARGSNGSSVVPL
jgi:hypothetical protein